MGPSRIRTDEDNSGQQIRGFLSDEFYERRDHQKAKEPKVACWRCLSL